MKIVCANCRTAFKVVAVKGDKSAVTDEKKVVARCPLCIDLVAMTVHNVPETERERDDLRLRVLDSHLWPLSGAKCARGQKKPEDFLVCPGCDVYGVIDKAYCDQARERYMLLEKIYDDGKDHEPDEADADDGDDDVRQLHPTAAGDDDVLLGID